MLQNKIITSTLWKFTERGVSQLFSLIVQIILARILAPNDFGVLAVLLVFVNISNVLIQKGFATALIQKKHIEDIDLNTVFLFSEWIALIIYIVLWFTAPYISNFYHNQDLSIYIRVISISLFFGAFYSIENSILIRKMYFKQMFYSSFISTVLSGLLGIILAVIGFGCWSLIIQNVMQQILLSTTSFKFCEWKIKLQYSKNSFNSLFIFGSKVLLSEILYTGVENIRTLMIGAKYSSDALAFYDRGQTYPSVAMRSIYDTLGSVLLPVFSKHQNNMEKLGTEIAFYLCSSFYLITPLFIGFALVSESFTMIFLSEKWLPAVPFIRVFCIYQLAILPYCILRNSLYGIGDSKISLKLECIKDILSLGAVLVGLMFGTFEIALLSTFVAWISTVLYFIVVNRIIRLKVKIVFEEFFKVCIYNIFMIIAISIVNHSIINPMITMIIDIIVGVVIYIFFSIIFRDKFFFYFLNRLSEAWRKTCGNNK